MEKHLWDNFIINKLMDAKDKNSLNNMPMSILILF